MPARDLCKMQMGQLLVTPEKNDARSAVAFYKTCASGVVSVVQVVTEALCQYPTSYSRMSLSHSAPALADLSIQWAVLHARHSWRAATTGPCKHRSSRISWSRQRWLKPYR